jgi:hypothetical protein
MARNDLTAEQLRELLCYDTETGVFTRRVASGYRGCHRAGMVLGTPSHGYLQVSVSGRRYQAHRLAWLYVHGTWPANEIDHINGVRSDNRIANLRALTHAENGQNLRRAKSHNKSGMLGIRWRDESRQWQARICVGGKTTYLGKFSTPEEAYAAYIDAKRRLHVGCTL